MTRLSLTDITDGKPVKLTIEIPARLHRRLVEYGMVLSDGRREEAPRPELLIPSMLERFVASDRGFARARKRLGEEVARSGK